MKKPLKGLAGKRRRTTQRQQAEARGKGFHPRGLARAIVHNQLKTAGGTGVNKPVYGMSNFAKHWRDEAAVIFGE